MEKKETKPITREQLANLNENCIQIIEEYIKENEMTVHGFSKLCGVHPNQMYLFLNRLRGLNMTTMQKIGEVLQG